MNRLSANSYQLFFKGTYFSLLSLQIVRSSCPDTDYLLEPPTEPNKQKTPVLQEFRGFAFEIVADELEDPAENE